MSPRETKYRGYRFTGILLLAHCGGRNPGDIKPSRSIRRFSRIPTSPRFLGGRNSSSDGSSTYALDDRPLGRWRLGTTTPFAFCFTDFIDFDFGGATSGRSSTCFVAETVASTPAEGSANVECPTRFFLSLGQYGSFRSAADRVAKRKKACCRRADVRLMGPPLVGPI